MAIDCCEHALGTLGGVSSKVTPISSTDRSSAHLSEHDVDLIVIGVSGYPVRRLFVSQIRQVYPRVPMLILRRMESDQGLEESIRGEFILSEDSGERADLEIVRSLRRVLPLEPCEHVHKGDHYDTVREVVRVINKHYANPDLDLTRVAKELPMRPAHLSRILNQQVGVSFRQLLKTTRIEEAKRMLASRKYSVKEIAARVGFSDSHYFSRSFKELTGQTASEFRSNDSAFG
jgi:YesN/AraC family two-component response regulator